MEQILLLERASLATEQEESMPSFLEWEASWREESLEFYLKQGWSYGIFEKTQLKAYFLAQPILFLSGQMQSLWLEHMYCSTKEQEDALLEVAYKTSREKHLQKLLYNPEMVKSLNLESNPLIQEKKYFFSTNTTKV